MAMLVLQGQTPIAKGGQRLVFVHPNDATKLIKVLRTDQRVRRGRAFGRVAEQLFPSSRIRQIRKEYQEYLRTMLANPDPHFRCPIAHMFGFVATDIGLGCLTEHVMEPDGTTGPTIGALAKSGDLGQAEVDLLNDTVARIYRHNIRASDMNASNFVVGHRFEGNDMGSRECVLVDGFGDIHAIPVRSMARWSNRLGLDDSCKRLARPTKLNWDVTTKKFMLQ